MTLELAPYLAQKDALPQNGRYVLAQHDDDTIVVYQAYGPAIGQFAATQGYFGGPFSLSRMSWIKPSFLWMMYRSGWGTKLGQEVVLAVWLRRGFFDQILRQAVQTFFRPGLWPSKEAWEQDLRQAAVRVQWDPDRTPRGGELRRRAIQLGLRGEVLRRYAGDPLAPYRGDAVVRIEDVTEFVDEQHQHVIARDYERLTVPRETPYPVTDADTGRRLVIGPEPEGGWLATIWQAARDGHVDQVRAWLDSGADANVQYDSGRTPLREAASHGHLDVVRLLLDRGVNVNGIDETGGTPLHPAACHGHLEVVKLLVERGADVHVRNSQGRTALHLAALNGQPEVVAFLVQLGADSHNRDNHGRTPMDDAAFYEHKGVVDFLARS